MEVLDEPTSVDFPAMGNPADRDRINRGMQSWDGEPFFRRRVVLDSFSPGTHGDRFPHVRADGDAGRTHRHAHRDSDPFGVSGWAVGLPFQRRSAHRVDCRRPGSSGPPSIGDQGFQFSAQRAPASGNVEGGSPLGVLHRVRKHPLDSDVLRSGCRKSGADPFRPGPGYANHAFVSLDSGPRAGI
jgi:hypothetical protein